MITKTKPAVVVYGGLREDETSDWKHLQNTITAQYIALRLGGKRSEGGNWMCCCPAHNDEHPSLSIRERDGKVLLHCFTGCAQADVIQELRARGLWPERERREWTAAQRREWARHQRELERDLPAARYFRRGVLVLLESAMDAEKGKLSDPTQGPADGLLIRDYTRWIKLLNHAGEETLVGEYRAWCAVMPELCAGLVRFARHREMAVIRAAVQYLEDIA